MAVTVGAHRRPGRPGGPVGYAYRVSLLRRKSTQVMDDHAADQATAGSDGATRGQDAPAQAEPRPRKGYTASKKERGVVTPKRPSPKVRRPNAQLPVSNRKLTKEERRELREQRRARRREITEGMRRGDDRYLTARDRGPERALARDVVDRRRTAGTWFFGGALFVLLLSGAGMPEQVRLAANIVWVVLALAVITDSVLLCRTTRRLIRQRFPNTEERMGSLYFYVVMRAMTFRRLRIPQPRVNLGDKI